MHRFCKGQLTLSAIAETQIDMIQSLSTRFIASMQLLEAHDICYLESSLADTASTISLVISWPYQIMAEASRILALVYQELWLFLNKPRRPREKYNSWRQELAYELGRIYKAINDCQAGRMSQILPVGVRHSHSFVTC